MRPFAVLFLVATGLGAQPPLPRGAELLKTDILTVLAHPDDEIGIASTLAFYSRIKDKTITNIYCTRGEGGGNMVGTHWGPSLGILREAELRRCLDTLGVTRWFFLDQVDWAYTESSAMTLAKWDREGALGKLVRYIRATRPEVILTMDPTPRAGQHGHHQAAGILTIEAFDAAADPSRFSDQLDTEGLDPWQPRKLFIRSFGSPGDGSDPLVTQVLPVGTTPEGDPLQDTVSRALRNHRSQGFDRFFNSRGLPRRDGFLLVKSVIRPDAPGDDLFEGLPIEGSPGAVPLTPARPTPELAFSFNPRPAVRDFIRWADANGAGNLTQNLTSDIPVVVGEENLLTLTATASAASEAVLEVEVPVTWSVSAPRSVHLRPGENHIRLAVVPPAGAKGDVEVAATLATGSITANCQTTVHPVPKLAVASVGQRPGRSDWENAAPVPISPEDIVQGEVESGADSSAVFRLLSGPENLHIDIVVRDQTVVSNVAPDDIRGHWRTDSVEICIDPAAGAEHTLGCFKVGIFPFDQAGNVRAARDADANQGPVERTAPGMTLESARTADGYRVRTAIPWSLVGPHDGRLGFNIIVYDGDKADAETGENINQSRLAWAPQRGVQGRPEDWGIITVRQ